MPTTLRRIEVLAFPKVQLLDVTGPLQVFASANDMLALEGKPPVYRPVVVATSREVTSSSQVTLGAEPLPRSNVPLDTLITPGGWGVNAASEDYRLIAWIQRRAAKARRTASVCSGAFLLAEAGLLDGKRATTHWQRVDEFRARFPDVDLDPDPIFIRDGNVWTSAGVTAGIDLALSFVEADCGRQLALTVARELVVFLKRPGGQSQYSATLALQQDDGEFDSLNTWINENLRKDLSLPALAERAHMSPRSFSRHYATATGRTPARAVEAIRIEAARRLLEQGASVAQASRRCGFGSEETMRRGFQRALGTNPQSYRERF